MRKCVKVKTAAELLSCGVSSVYELFHEGKVEGFRLGKKGIRIYEDSLEKYQERVRTKEGVGKERVGIRRKRSARRAMGAFIRSGRESS